MRSFLATFLIATIASAALVPIVRILAIRAGAMSKPGGRHVHGAATPRLGGIAIFASFFVALGLIAWLHSSVGHTLRDQSHRAFGLLAGAVVLSATGAIDDVRGLRALYKLLLQIVAASIAFSVGIRIDAVSLPFIGTLQMGIFAYPITVLWVAGIVNAINLIDGLDGLAAGVAIFAAMTNFVVACISGQALVAVLMAALLGSTLGFLFYNFNPARIFMGDSGSYFIGYVLAVSALLGNYQKTSTTVALLVPIVALGVPIFDTLFSMVRRFLERRSIFSPDRGHIHHRLVDMGLTHRRAVLIIYGASAMFTVSALAIALGRSWQVGFAIFAAALVLIALVRFVGYFEYTLKLRRQRERFRTAETEHLRRFVASYPSLLACANTEEEVAETLRAAVGVGQITAIEVHLTGLRDSVRWGQGETARNSLNYPLGEDHNARAYLVFDVETEGELPSDQEILLQVLADLTATRLREVGISLAAAESFPTSENVAAAALYAKDPV